MNPKKPTPRYIILKMAKLKKKKKERKKERKNLEGSKGATASNIQESSDKAIS